MLGALARGRGKISDAADITSPTNGAVSNNRTISHCRHCYAMVSLWVISQRRFTVVDHDKLTLTNQPTRHGRTRWKNAEMKYDRIDKTNCKTVDVRRAMSCDSHIMGAQRRLFEQQQQAVSEWHIGHYVRLFVIVFANTIDGPVVFIVAYVCYTESGWKHRLDRCTAAVY